MKLPENPLSSLYNAQSDPDAAETENALRAALPQAYAAENASSELRQRITDMAALHNERQVMQSVRRPRLLFKLAMAVMIVAALPIVLLWPRLSTALLLYRVQTAILRTHNAHLTTWTYAANGKSTLESKVWYRNGMWRVERQGSKIIEIYVVDRGYVHNANTNTLKSLGMPPPVYDNYTGFHLRDTPGIAARHGFHSRMEKMEQYMLAGEKVDVYRLREPMYPQKRIVIELDANTHLPRRTLWSHEEHGRMVTERITVFGFDESTTPGMFSIKINSPNGVQEIRFNESKF